MANLVRSISGAQGLRRQAELVRQAAGGHRGEILDRQHRQLGVVAAGPQRELGVAAGMVEFDLGPVRQFAHDFIQRRGRGGAGAVAGGRGGHVLDDGDFHVGGGQRKLAVPHRDHDVRQDGDGVAPLHHTLDVGQRLDQGGAVGLELHGQFPT